MVASRIDLPPPPPPEGWPFRKENAIMQGGRISLMPIPLIDYLMTDGVRLAVMVTPKYHGQSFDDPTPVLDLLERLIAVRREELAGRKVENGA